MSVISCGRQRGQGPGVRVLVLVPVGGRAAGASSRAGGRPGHSWAGGQQGEGAGGGSRGEGQGVRLPLHGRQQAGRRGC